VQSELVFVSKRDRWVAVLIWGLVLWVLGTGIARAATAGDLLGRLLLVGISCGVAACVLWFWFTTRYRLTERSLHLHSGPLHREIPFEKIRAVREGGRLLAMSYGLSLAGLQVEVEGSWLGYQVSPADRSGFMHVLAERCGHLVRQGKDLVMPPGAG